MLFHKCTPKFRNFKLSKDELKNFFRPEFLNRIDEIVVFHRLNNTHLQSILNIQLQIILKRLAEITGVEILGQCGQVGHAVSFFS